jgi:hypothetical protein
MEGNRKYDGSFGTPENLGESINSTGDENFHLSEG